jgi:hypothetical protein
MKSKDYVRCDKCRDKLIEVAKAHGKITFRELGAHLGLIPRSAGCHLDEIYENEMRRNRPDLTLVVVYEATGYGPFLTRGGSAKSVRMDPMNQEQRKAYDQELEKVYATDWEAT